MGKTSDLMGLGMPGPLAANLGYDDVTVVAAGTTAATATEIGLQASFVTVDTATSQTGVKLNASTPLFKPIIITSPDSDTAIVYPPTSGTINGGTATTGGQNLAQNKTAMYIRQTAVKWVSILTG
jgi:hypothetical protein